MDIQRIPLVARDLSLRSALFQKKIELSTIGDSDAYMIPITNVNLIATKITGDITMYVTNYAAEDVEADTAEWDTWDGSSKINNAATYLYFELSSGTGIAMITVRGTL